MKARQHTSSVKHRKEEPTLVTPDRSAGRPAREIPVKPEGSRDEREAELTVTRYVTQYSADSATPKPKIPNPYGSHH